MEHIEHIEPTGDFVLDGLLYLDNRETVVFGGKNPVAVESVLSILAELGSTRNTADAVGAFPHEMILFVDHQAAWTGKTWQDLLGGQRRPPKTFWKHPDFNTTVMDPERQLTLIPHSVIEICIPDSTSLHSLHSLDFSRQPTLIPERSSNAHLIHRQEVAVEHDEWQAHDHIPF